MQKLKFLFIILSVFLYTSCDSNAVRGGRNLYKKYLKTTLNDPESLKIYDEKFTEKYPLTVTFQVDYGAKNEFGGYVRKTSVFETIGEDPSMIDVDGKKYYYMAPRTKGELPSFISF